MQYRADLDGLRAVAVLLVLLYHATVPLPGAFLGVDIFFTLSGFLITSLITTSLEQRTFKLSSFYIRRSFRLIPAALSVVALTASAALALLPFQRARQATISAIAAIASVSNFRYLLQSGYFDADSFTKPLLHTWSLAVEEQFYLAWPLLLVFAHRHLHPRVPLLFSAAVVIISPFLSHLLLQNHPSAAFYLAPARFYELLTGAALSYVPRPTNSAIRQMSGLAASLGILASVLFISTTDQFPSWRALLPCVSTALLIHAGPHSFISQFLSSQPFVFIGKISYSVYLTHWPVTVFYRLLTHQSDVFNTGERLFILSASILLGYSLHVLVEKRFRISTKQEFDPVSGDSTTTKTHYTTLNSSAYACGRLFAVVILVQLSLSLALGLLYLRESRETTLSIEEPLVHYENDSLTPGDDYNAFNIESVFRLTAEMEKGFPGRLRKPDTIKTYGSTFYYENGSFPAYKSSEGPTADIPKIGIIGDSHAKSWSGLAYHLSVEFNAHVEVWTAPGCVLLLRVYHVMKTPRLTESCRKTLKSWKEHLVAEPFDTVVMAGRWAWLVMGDVYGKEKSHFLIEETAPLEERKIPNDDDLAAALNETRRLFRKSLLGTVKFLTGLGSRVVLMNQVPLLLTDPGDCTSYPDAKAAIAVRKQPERCVSVTREQALSRLKYVGEVMKDVQSTVGEMVQVVNPSELFCDNFLQDEAHCRVVVKDAVLYRDRNHLNKLGAMYYALRWKAVGYNGMQWKLRRMVHQL